MLSAAFRQGVMMLIVGSSMLGKGPDRPLVRTAQPNGRVRERMELRIQLLAIAGSGLMFVLVLELVRRRAFLERYALLWLLSALVLLALSIWRGGLEQI